MGINTQAYIIDPTVLLLYFIGNEDAKMVIESIIEEHAYGYILEPMLAELFQRMVEHFGYTVASSRLEAIKNSNIRLINVDFELIRDAGRIKASNPSMPMVYAYMIALAKKFNAIIVTADTRLRASDPNAKIEYINL
ncbi:MAG: PIN domain-containing protein [Candidatus Nitrosocaldus sp.]